MRLSTFATIVSLCLAIASLSACTTETAQQSKQNNAEASRINVQLGLRYLQQGNRVRAKQKLLQAVEQQRSEQSYAALAYFYETTQQIDLAKQFYLKAIDEAPGAGAGHNNYGAFLCRQKQYQAADKQFNLAVADTKYLNSAAAYENAGLCAMMIPDAAKAKQYFIQALQQNPNRATSLEQLAQITFSAGQYQQAAQYANRYVALGKPSAAGLGLAIKINLQIKARAKVVQYTKQLKALYPNSTQFQQYKMYV